MFSKKSPETNKNSINIATNGSVAASNVNGTILIQNNISPIHYTKSEILEKVYNSNPDDWTYNDDDGIYLYSKDILLQIRKIRTDELVPFEEPWVKNYPDKTATRAVFSVLYNNISIEKFYFASVDGARMFIPYPKSCVDLRIAVPQYLVAKIINDPRNGHYDFDDYLQRAKISVDENL